MSQASPKQRIRIPLWLRVSGAVVLLLLLLAYNERRRGRVQLAAIRAEIEQAGHPLATPDVSSKASPAQEQFDRRLKAIGDTYDKVLLKMIDARVDLGAGKAARGSQAPHPILDKVETLLTNETAIIKGGEVTTWQLLEAVQENNVRATMILRGLILDTPVGAHNHFFDGYSVGHLRPGARALSDAVVLQLYRGELEGAEANLVALARLPQIYRGENLVTSMFRAAISDLGTALLWDAIQSDGWTDTQLANLQSAWDKYTILPGLVRGLHLERIYRSERYGKFKQESYRSWKTLGNDQLANWGATVEYPFLGRFQPHGLLSPVMAGALGRAGDGRLFETNSFYDDASP